MCPRCAPPLTQMHPGKALVPYFFGPDKVVKDGWVDDGWVDRQREDTEKIRGMIG